ncbi:MAG TPA: cupin domain-containing protein [Chitinophagaceae bacterium]|nr:cupin domain-containing protein [Chitinophagaceae bacterium]
MKKIPLFLVAFFLYGYSTVRAQEHTGAVKHKDSAHIMFNAMDLKWGDGPSSLPKGVQMAVLEGNPSKEGMFTLRATVPANYKIPPHWHPVTEHVTVLEGSLYMGMGEKLDESKAIELKPGGFAAMPANTAHYAFTKDKCVIQLHAMGPFAITYINPADDPRTR